MSDKYKLRPSGASRWMTCPASLILEATVPPVMDDTHVAAFEGTAAHELLEMCVKAGCRAEKFIGKTLTVFEEDQMTFPYNTVVGAKMIATVNFFLDEVGEPPKGTVVFSELHMTHSEIPELSGTADYFAYNEAEGCGLLADLKNGSSIVQVKNRKGELNKQLLSYAALLFDKFPKLDTLTMAIIQPNGKTKAKTRDTGINREIAEMHIDSVKKAAKLADKTTEANLNVITSVGSHCWYCKAKDICPAKTEKELEKDFG
jgi:hypothetical protein